MAITQIKSTGIANGAVTSENLGTLSNISVSGTSNLGNVANVTITGGNVGQVLTTDGTGNLSWATPAATGPTITQIQITDSSYNVIDDTAVSTSGGYIKITGTGFSAGAIVVVGNINATSTTFVSSTVLNVQVPSAVAGTYTVYVVNTNGSTAIGVNGLTYSGTPNWVTGSSLPNGLSGSPISIQLSATGDAPLTYALAAGNTLPTGLTLTSGGLLSGTITVASETVYAFTIIAIDAEAQDSPRAFTITITNADPYFYLTTLLLPGNGTNNGTNNTFIDDSTNNFTITRNGNTTQGTYTPFSLTGWSNYFDRSGDTLTIADNAALEIGSGDFTFEAWIYLTAFSGTYGGSFYGTGICGKDNESTRSYSFQILAPNTSSYTGLSLVLFSGGGNVQTSANYSFQLNQWYHVAVARQSGTVRFFVNGVLIGSGTNTTSTNNGSQPFSIGSAGLYTGYEYFFPGYISNFRFVNGTAVYTANFTPSTTPLTAIANTAILTCQSNRFIDNSTNNFAITRNGDTSVQSFSPFAPTSSYTTSIVGGSAYFDGSGDNLTIAQNAAFTLGSSGNNFTIECYVYLNGSQTAASIIFSSYGDWNSSYNNMYALTANGSNIIWFNDFGNSGITAAVNLYSWNHIAIVRNSSTITMYINGVNVGTQTSGQNYTVANSVKFGSLPSSGTFNGYISSFRLVNGTAVYTSNFTPPTAPLTNITNTSLLCNFTNGQIIDATSKNIIETAGDAKISTAQSKWGGSSMYFDGTTDKLSIPFTNSFLELGINGEKFTLEAWIYPTNTMASTGQIISKGGGTASWSTTNGAQYQLSISSSAITWGFNSSGSAISVSGGTVTLNAWQHVAVTYDGTTTKVFLNGVQQGTSTSSYTAPTTRNLQYIGMTQSGGFTQDYYGYINDLRITKGYARYTTNFTPPSGAFATL